MATGGPGVLGRVPRLVRDMQAQRSVRALFRSSLDLVARKIAGRRVARATTEA